MLKLIVKKIDNYNYHLQDKFNRKYNLNIEFYNLKNSIKINDYIYMNEKLIRKINNQAVSFGPLDGNYGKNIESSDDEDIIMLVTDNKKIYLKRFYG